MDTLKTDILVIGGGSGGLSVAAGASQMGAKVILCEADKMGGDCLNTGCVPSKALIASSRTMASAKGAKQLGIATPTPTPDFKGIHAHIQKVIETIAPHDSVERFESLGVHIIQSAASFIDNNTVEAGNVQIKAKYIVIATGSSPFIPPITGLDTIDFLTNETLFNLKDNPESLAIIGGGPIGCEIAQAYALLGCKVLLLEAAPHILAAADKGARALLHSSLKESGVTLYENCKIDAITQQDDLYNINTSAGELQAKTLLIATGRKPNIKALALDKTTIDHTSKGITVNKRLRTSQRRIYAIGDVASPLQFTHAAGYQAGIVIRNILFKLPAKVSYHAFPWVVYTTPEIAHVGVSIEEAHKQNATFLHYELKDNDRAIAENDRDGFINVAIGKKGRLLGVTIVASHAGELITPWTLAIHNKLTIKHMAGFIAPYPTISEAHKRIAGSYFTPMLYSAKTRKIVRFLMNYF